MHFIFHTVLPSFHTLQVQKSSEVSFTIVSRLMFVFGTILAFTLLVLLSGRHKELSIVVVLEASMSSVSNLWRNHRKDRGPKFIFVATNVLEVNHEIRVAYE